MTLKVGLTGGIGSGKSTACQYFADLGAPIISADKIAKDLLSPNTASTKTIIEHFGEQVLDASQKLDRKKLRGLIFSDSEAKAWLEALLHPSIRAEIKQQIASLATPYVIIEIPLLLENKGFPELDRVLVIDCLEETQVKRATKRDNLTEADILATLKEQINRNERLALADDIISNEGSLKNLAVAVKDMHDRYIKAS